MTSDPFADGMPAGDFHHWERPPSEPCPDCPCCSLNLCLRAIEKKGTCYQYGNHSAGYDLNECPCWQRDSPARERLAEKTGSS